MTKDDNYSVDKGYTDATSSNKITGSKVSNIITIDKKIAGEVKDSVKEDEDKLKEIKDFKVPRKISWDEFQCNQGVKTLNTLFESLINSTVLKDKKPLVNTKLGSAVLYVVVSYLPIPTGVGGPFGVLATEGISTLGQIAINKNIPYTAQAAGNKPAFERVDKEVK